MTTISDVTEAIEAGLATVAGLSPADVSDDVPAVLGRPVGLLVDAGFEGGQDYIYGGDVEHVWRQTWQPTIVLTVHNPGNVREMYANSRAIIMDILAWFRANDTLGGLVTSCHPISFSASDVYEEGKLIQRVTTITPSPIQIDDIYA